MPRIAIDRVRIFARRLLPSRKVVDDGAGFLMSLFEEMRSLAVRLDAIVMANSRSVDDYSDYLLRTFGFESPVDAVRMVGNWYETKEMRVA